MAVTTNAQGYQVYQEDQSTAMLSQPNPWASAYSADTQAQQTNSAQANQTIGTLQNQMASYSGGQTTGDASAYPAMQNQWGLGAAPAAASNPSYATQPVNIGVTDSASRGFNPWSLQGESNVRGK